MQIQYKNQCYQKNKKDYNCKNLHNFDYKNSNPDILI